MGYGPEESSAVFELTFNYGTKEYAKGHAYLHTVWIWEGKGGVTLSPK